MSRTTVLFSTAIASALTMACLGVLDLPPSSPRPAATEPEDTPSPPTSGAEVAISGEMIVHADWLDWLGDSFWRGFRERPARRELHRREEPGGRRTAPQTTYRTVCVRLCDGFFWPLSFATGRDRLAQDARQCEKACPSRARLFLHRNPGEKAEDMVDLDGRPYRKLSTAFLYRTHYVTDCTCRGQPWEEEALARHRAYAAGASSKTRTARAR